MLLILVDTSLCHHWLPLAGVQWEADAACQQGRFC